MNQGLVFEDVAFSFAPGAEILRGVSAQVPLSGLTFLLGKSGGGKSAFCRLAVGLLRPQRGRILLLGQELQRARETELRALRRQVPYLVQGPALLDWLSVEENVLLAAREVGAGSSEVLGALERVGLGEVATRLPASLGPGVNKRAAIARALVLSPRFLILDEPTTGLDRGAAAQVYAVIESLHRQGLGALVISHDHRAASAMADSLLVLEEGRVRVERCADG